MTKTLTEQWREGTLPEDCYYILTKNGHIRKDRTCFYSHTDEQCFCFTSNKDIQEVLAPVPSYDKWKQMIDGDKATIHHLKKILPMIEYNKVAYDYLKQVIEDMEKEIEEVK